MKPCGDRHEHVPQVFDSFFSSRLRRRSGRPVGGPDDARAPVAAQPRPTSFASPASGETRSRRRARAARAGEARPAIVSALEDPMISPSLDHLPFMLGGADVSVTIEQRIPLSGIRGHRRASALADLDRLRADANRTTLDVGVQAANAFLMLQERRRTAALVTEQIAFRARRRDRGERAVRERNGSAVRRAARRSRGRAAGGVREGARQRGARRGGDAQHEPRSGRRPARAAHSPRSRSRSRFLPGPPSRPR